MISKIFCRSRIRDQLEYEMDDKINCSTVSTIKIHGSLLYHTTNHIASPHRVMYPPS